MKSKPLTSSQAKALRAVFANFSAVKLAYLFGSRAAGTAGPTSDYDFAVYLDGVSPTETSDIRLSLLDRLCQALRTDRVDLVVLNGLQAPELRHAIIRDGILLRETEPYKVLVEPRIMAEYFDFRALLQKHHLTHSA